MPTVTITYTLPDEHHDYDSARLGRDACGALWEIDQRCRSLIQNGEPTDEERGLAEEIRAIIREECAEALEL